MHNPFFSSLPWQLSKGETLTIRCDGLGEGHIINHGIYICPEEKNLFKVGATYEWKELNYTPTPSAKATLTDAVNKILKVPYTIENHFASIRPTVRERRPFIGLHPVQPSIGIFNGLGTKGVLLAPYFAHHFANHLVNKTALDREVNISRFS